MALAPPPQVPGGVDLPVTSPPERAAIEIAAFLHNNKDTILQRVSDCPQGSTDSWLLQNPPSRLLNPCIHDALSRTYY